MSKRYPVAWARQFHDNVYLSDPDHRDKDFPEPITMSVPAHLRRGGVGRVLRPKECHHRAYEYTSAHPTEPGLRLVYGTYRGIPFADHSWVELPGDITFDGTQMEFYRTSEYRVALQTVPIRVYTAIEVIDLCIDTDHTGPWTEADCIRVLGYIPGAEQS